MLAYDASLALRVEILETAVTALFETLPKGRAARAALVDPLRQRVRDAGFAHISTKLDGQDA